jgi:hypothetical protein
MKAFETFSYYQSIRLHFTSEKYDAIKYNFTTNTKEESFRKRRDSYFFEKLGRKFNNRQELIYFFISYFISDKNWIGDMISDESIWTEWQRRNSSLLYTFEQDLNKLQNEADSFDSLFIRNNDYPEVILYYLRDEICIETIVILDQLTNFINKEEGKIKETILWPNVSKKIKKYSRFVHFDKEKAKKNILKVFTS